VLRRPPETTTQSEHKTLAQLLVNVDRHAKHVCQSRV